MATNLRTGSKFIDMITGKEVMIKEMNGDTAILEDGTAMGNPDTYMYLGNDTPESVPDVHLDTFSHKLTVNGKTVETGTLRIQDVIAAFAGGAILAVTAKNDSKKCELFAYKVNEDVFMKLMVPASDTIKKIYDRDGIWAVITRSVFPAKFKNEEDETVEKDAVKGSVMVYDGCRRLYERTIETNSGWDLGEAMPVTAEDVILLRAARKVQMEEDVDGVSRAIVNDKAEASCHYLELVLKKREADEDEDEDEGVYVSSYDINYDGAAAHIVVQHDKERSLLLSDDDKFVYTNNGYHYRTAYGKEAAETAKQYPYVVGFHSGTHKNVFVLANDKRETKTVTVVKTDDRGYIVTVE